MTDNTNITANIILDSPSWGNTLIYTNSFDITCGINWGEIKRAWVAWMDRLFPQSLEPNPLPILSRALNSLKLNHRIIRQPCWKRGRWKSKT